LKIVRVEERTKFLLADSTNIYSHSELIQSISIYICFLLTC